ncbi:MAG: T9SS type A sorting domain-containing protein [Chitinophagaceae bacterium]|nr:T9SS type A sorting domain-containing protein [Chitinophagaceae bacterium]
MNYVQKTLALLFLLAIAITVSAQTKYSTVTIVPPQDKQQRAELLGLLEIDHFDMRDGKIVAEINQQQIALLRQTSFQYEVVIPDVAAHINELNQRYFAASPAARVAMEQTGGLVEELIPTPSAFQVHPTLGGFYSFAQMNTAMNNLAATYSSLVQKTSLGLSVQGRDIWCIKISDNVTTDEVNEPEVLYIGLQHAREAIGGSSLIFFMQYLCENYATDSRIQALVNNREIFIIPCMNPDGWEYNRVNDPNGGGGWRKNRRNNGDGTFGVDLNRNWSFDWGNCSGASSSCGSSNTSSDVYWGPSAFSEPETQAVRNFVISHHLVSMIDQHAFGPYYSLPFGRPSLHPGVDSLTIMDQDYYDHVPAAMGKYNGMRAGNSIQSVGYEVAGGVKDWMLKAEIGVGTKGKIYGLTGEGGAGGGTGGSYGSFWPPASEIISLSKGMVYQNLQILFSAGSYVDITDQADIALTAPSGSLGFKIKRIGIADGPVTVTLIPLENIASVGSPVIINSLPNYCDTYNGSIGYSLPGNIQAGHRIKYAWRVQTGGQTYYDTLIKFYNPVQLFYDNMEGASVATNWVVSANWNYTTAMAFAGTKSLTESPSGLYGQNRNDIIRYNGSFNLSDATAAYLTFQVRHRAENFRDKLEVQVSTNGTTWIPVAGSTTVEEPGTLDGSTLDGDPALTGIREDWVPEVYNLSAFIGQPALQLRLVFSSDANTTGYDFQVDEGFNIDDLKVIKSTTALVILPVHFISFTGRLQQDNTAELNWQIALNSDPDYFSIERSANGTNFWEAGRVSGQQFTFIDRDLFAGNNYYRIKAAGVDRTTTYSNIITIIYKPGIVSLQLYPNPASDEINIKIIADGLTDISIRITDLAGRVIHNSKANISSGGDIKINSSWWTQGLYYLQVTDDKNNVLATEKILKQ